jgi:hypothetical protein
MCRKEIPSGAKICTECDSYQDWRRYFGLSSTILSLLVALVSVLTVAVPVLRHALTADRSEIRCNVLGWNENSGEVTLVVSNKGPRPSAIKALTLQPNTSKIPESPFQFDSDFSDPILEPGKYKTVTFHSVINGVRATRLDSAVSLRPNYHLNLTIFPFAHESPEISCDNWDRFK